MILGEAGLRFAHKSGSGDGYVEVRLTEPSIAVLVSFFPRLTGDSHFATYFAIMSDEATGNQLRIDVLAFEDRAGVWIAQGIQYDIVARAKSVGGIQEAFMRQLAANLALNTRFGRRGLEGIPPAPEQFRALFDDAKEMLQPLSPSRNPHVREKLDIRLVDEVA